MGKIHNQDYRGEPVFLQAKEIRPSSGRQNGIKIYAGQVNPENRGILDTAVLVKVPIFPVLTKPAVQTSKKAFGLIIDVSSSMANDRLKAVKKAACDIVQKMKVGTKLFIETFAHGANLIQPLIEITEDNRLAIIEHINSLTAAGDTNFHRIPDALEDLKGIEKSTVFVLTDGKVEDNASLDASALKTNILEILGANTDIVPIGVGNLDFSQLASLSTLANSGYYQVNNNGQVLDPEQNKVVGDLAGVFAKNMQLPNPSPIINSVKYNKIWQTIETYEGIVDDEGYLNIIFEIERQKFNSDHRFPIVVAGNIYSHEGKSLANFNQEITYSQLTRENDFILQAHVGRMRTERNRANVEEKAAIEIQLAENKKTNAIPGFLKTLRNEIMLPKWNQVGIGLFGHKTPAGIQELRGLLANYDPQKCAPKQALVLARQALDILERKRQEADTDISKLIDTRAEKTFNFYKDFELSARHALQEANPEATMEPIIVFR